MSIWHIAVIGAGTMSDGIAQIYALAGINAALLDVTDEALENGVATLATNLVRQVRKRSIIPKDKQDALARIPPSFDYSVLSAADLKIETVTETLELKKHILKQIDSLLSDHCIIATNTSTVSIAELATIVTQPSRFIGLHFFNPVPLMALVEVIRGIQTSDVTHILAIKLADQIGKSAVTARNSPGFVVNRFLCPMINEAIFVLQEELACAKDVDTGMQLGCNHLIGALALADLVGLDTMLAIMEGFHQGFDDPKYRPPQLFKEMAAAGYLVRKTSHGFYTY